MRLKDYLTEMSMKQIDVSDIVTKKYVEALDTSDLEGYLYDYKYQADIDDNELDDDDIIDSPEFLEFVQSELETRFYEAKYDIERTTKNGYITIFRSMTVKPKWFEKLEKHKHLGIYWSWDKQSAEAHWGKFGSGHKTIKLVSKIKEKYVDWQDTFELNINPTIGSEEREIRLFKNTPIKLDAIYVESKEIDISNIKDKVFRA